MKLLRSLLHSLLSSAQTSQGLKQSALAVLGDVAAAGISAVALIIFSRLLGPSRFGEFSIGFAIVLILTRISDAGLTSSALKYSAGEKDKDQTRQVFSYILSRKLALAGAALVLCFLFIGQIANLLDFHNYTVLSLAFTLFFGTVLYEQLLYILQSLHLFTRSVLANLLQASFKFISALIMVLSSSTSSIFAFVCYVIAPLFPVLFSSFMTPKWLTYTNKITAVNKSTILGMAKHSSIAFIAAGLIENLDPLFIQKYLTTYEAGLYSGVMKIAMVLSLVAFSLGNVLNARVARYSSKSHRESFIKKAALISLLSILGFVGFVPFTGLLINLSIGPAYNEALPQLLILIASSFVMIATAPWIALFYSFESNWYFSISGAIQLVIVVLGNVIFLPTFGLSATAWVRLASKLFLLFFSVGLALWFNRRDSLKPQKILVS